MNRKHILTDIFEQALYFLEHDLESDTKQAVESATAVVVAVESCLIEGAVREEEQNIIDMIDEHLATGQIVKTRWKE